MVEVCMVDEWNRRHSCGTVVNTVSYNVSPFQPLTSHCFSNCFNTVEIHMKLIFCCFAQQQRTLKIIIFQAISELMLKSVKTFNCSSWKLCRCSSFRINVIPFWFCLSHLHSLHQWDVTAITKLLWRRHVLWSSYTSTVLKYYGHLEFC